MDVPAASGKPAATESPVANADRRNARPGMKWIPGGTFWMGSDDHYPEEAPAHKVTVAGFWMDEHTVTNRQFSRFVERTRYITLAERAPNPADYPDAQADLLVPASSVFRQPGRPVALDNPYHWWVYVPGADWRHPQGPGSSLNQRLDHPVVHVAWEDVEAYANWADKELPTEAEWEFAPEVAWTVLPIPGATSSRQEAAGWPTLGRGNFRSAIRAKTAITALHPSVATLPTATACST